MSAFKGYLDSELVWQYLTLGQLDKIESLYPEDYFLENQKQKNINLIKPHLEKNEKCILFEETYYDYGFTSFARVFNCRHKRFIQPIFLKTDIEITLRGKKYSFKEIFQQQGWKFNINKLTKLNNNGNN